MRLHPGTNPMTRGKKLEKVAKPATRANSIEEGETDPGRRGFL